ncbi:MAG: YggS family pyridoxal phosphate-dependent enzyme [Nocardioidaceae bacterium]
MTSGGDRRDELAAGLRDVHRRIAAAAARVGRDPADITLVVVTKTYPATDVLLLAELGVRDIGENRHPESRDKAAAVSTSLGDDAEPLRWHFVGGLQTNKAAAVADYADLVHSVDRTRLVAALARGASRRGRIVRCLVQVDLDPEGPRPGRSGATPANVPALADLIAAESALQLGGVMAVAPLDSHPRVAFERLLAVANRMREEHPGATDISAGMSGDLEAAIEVGATHVRVGRAVLGERPPLG